MATGYDQPAAAPVPRYTSSALPSYPYRLGRAPHPRRDPQGHSFGLPEPVAPAWETEQWATLEPWLFAVDLFNLGYWWEAHEQFEALWHAAGRTTPRARFVQGLIKVAAACLHRAAGDLDVARDQAEAGVSAMLAATGGVDYMGADVSSFAAGVRACMSRGDADPLLRLRVSRL